MKKNLINITFLNSLSKVIDGKIDLLDEIKEINMFKNERYSFQVAIESEGGWCCTDVKIKGIDKRNITISNVKYVYGKYLGVYSPEGKKTDDLFIHKGEGMFPDLLLPYGETKIHINHNSLNILFVEIFLTKEEKELSKDLTFSFTSQWNDKLGSKKIRLNIIDKSLPENELLVTHWFHYDCLAEYYHLKVFSKQYYKVLDNFLTNYVRYGNTMLLVPLFTPCLDTLEGKERLTVQLIDVEYKDGSYVFNFDKLDYFLKFIKSKGIKYFEFSHLFTQWGAKCCPKIEVKVNGKKEKRFGWNIASDSEEYYSFLSLFLPQLDKFLKANNYNKISYFHISDEPNMDSIERYSKHQKLMKQYLSDYKFMDALSDYSFKDHVDLPVVSDDHIQKFLDNNVPSMVYYCCAQGFDNVPNAFINMPSIRNRVIGFMMYFCDTLGFLQWGYNFYHSGYSKECINPFIYNDGVGNWNPGDPFIVYPGLNYEPLSSIRLVVFNEAIQDYRLCKEAEKIIGKNKVKEIIRESGIENYTTYKHDNNALLNLREKLIKKINK